MQIYVYSLIDNSLVEVIEADDAAACEAAAEEKYGSNDFGWTYSPAFDAVDGLNPL